MDAMILFLTQGVTRAKSKKSRVFLAALVASVIVPISIFMPDSWLMSSLGKVFYSFFIVWAAYSFSSLRAFFFQWVTFYFITFAIGGSMLGVHFFLATEISIQGGSVVTFTGGYGDPVSWIFVLIGFPCSFIFTKWRLEQVSVHRMKLENIYDVSVRWSGKKAVCKGLVDSGNQLIDPVSRKMVFLADPSVLKQLMDQKELDLLQVDHVVTSMEELPDEIQKAVRLVPYSAAGIKGQLLVTLLVDSITIETPEGHLEIKQALLGVQQQDLTHDRLYQLLIHPHVMVKGKSA
ncbi:sigma-E processing peptidase SpoIIGA [Halobacillus mangrovi]|uniref:Sporulation sigma-E factor-processing peptidase n=2 Tax=Halobacillus mangrovi TaxID=402384 RepID=A0A1W6A0V3_9BACI|nr:sigma-E processing peptidase SpoIIGA [Halobacillus mangrovi]